VLASEFRKRVEFLGIDEDAKKKVLDLIVEAGKDFPCLECPSKETCENFKWFIKWFGQ
jgi:hypothetical protein